MKKQLNCLLFLLIANTVFATDIYLSSNGNDGNDGSTSEKAVATLSKAVALIPTNSSDYIIKVSGIIPVTSEVLINRNISFTMEGDTEMLSGFDGGNTSRILHLQNAAGATVLKNLIFRNGYTTAEGGAIRIDNSGKCTLLNCIIRNNQSVKAGGGIALFSSAQSETAVTIQNTLIANNESTNNGGGGIFIDNNNANNQNTVAIINSTIYKNRAKTYGGAIYVSGKGNGNSSLTFVNVTVVENRSQGNGGHCGGLNVRDADGQVTLKVYNSIWEDNLGENNGSPAYRDIGFSGGTAGVTQGTYASTVFFNHSFIGLIGGITGSVPAGNTVGYGTGKAAGLATPGEDYIASQNSIPLDFFSDALEYGDAQYLQNLNVNTDQTGNIRAFADGKCAAGAVEVPATFVVTNPDPHEYQHFLIYGQSLSVGQESFYPISTENVPGNYMIGNQMWINYGNTNLDLLNPLVSSRQISYPLTCENPLVAAVNHLQQQKNADSPTDNTRFIATSCGTGAQPIANLAKGSERGLYERDFLTAIKQAQKITIKSGSSISCPAIFWMQGENDYNSTKLPKDEYKEAMLKLKTDMQTDIRQRYHQTEKPVFFTYQTGGGWTNGNRELLIGMAQLEASNENGDVICVGPVYQLSFSNNHLCSNGSRWFGEYMAKVYYKTQVLGEEFKPLQPKTLYRDAQNPNKVIVRFHVPVPPLAFDSLILEKRQNYGFSIYKDNAKQTISNVEIVNDCVEITCTNALTGNIEVLYGEKNTINGVGNLRDSDPYLSKSTYVDGDTKDETGNYIYPRVDKEDCTGVLRESFRPVTREPLDETGEIIYGKPYPLYNFSLAFNYKLAAGQDTFAVPNMEQATTGLPRIPVTYNAVPNSTELYNLSGVKIGQWRNAAQPDLSQVPLGVYIVRNQYDGGVETKKIVVK
ncbi:hypothetical protein FACS189413_02340 [Bacteroidia bacterium]|nr:hypothetical protein FACS189463_1640 [Bacteroidia bacterium]GHU67489.1 hypothetical protein FACS189413_02340 [Bacteroidia bacterium]